MWARHREAGRLDRTPTILKGEVLGHVHPSERRLHFLTHPTNEHRRARLARFIENRLDCENCRHVDEAETSAIDDDRSRVAVHPFTRFMTEVGGSAKTERTIEPNDHNSPVRETWPSTESNTPANTTIIGPVGPDTIVGVPPRKAATKPTMIAPHTPAIGPAPEASPNASINGNVRWF